MFPSSLPNYTNFSVPITLQAMNHTSRHKQMEADITAIATKVGVDGSAVTSTLDYKIASALASVASISGQLPSFATKTGVETLTNKTLTSPTINGGSVNSATVVTPTIASFTNANHTHANSAGGGQLSESAFPANSIGSSRLNLDMFESALPAGYATPTASNWYDTGLAITLPSAGKYWLSADLRVKLATITNSYGSVRLYNVTTGAAVPNTERIGQNPAAGDIRMPTTITKGITTATINNVIRVELKPGGAYSCSLETDANGVSVISALRVG